MNFINQLANRSQHFRVKETDQIFLSELQELREKVERHVIGLVDSSMAHLTDGREIELTGFDELFSYCSDKRIEISPALRDRFQYRERKAAKRKARNASIEQDLAEWGIDLKEKINVVINLEEFGLPVDGVKSVKVSISGGKDFQKAVEDIKKFPLHVRKYYANMKAWVVLDSHAQHVYLWYRLKREN